MGEGRPVKTTKKGAPVWVMSTYFAEGFPLGLIRMLSSAYFKDHGASLQAIGLTSLFGLPWTIKFLWAPIADAFSTKRRWLLLMEGILAVGTAVLAFAEVFPSPLQAAALIFLILAFFSASHDIAIDGFYLEHLDRKEQAQLVGFQAMSYRIALIVAGGGVAWLAGKFSWRVGYLVAALLLAALWFFHSFFLPKREVAKRPMAELAPWVLRPRTLAVLLLSALIGGVLRVLLSRPELSTFLGIVGRISLPNWIVICLFFVLAIVAIRAQSLKKRLYASSSPYALAFVDYLAQDRIAIILAFIISFRLGEALLQNMAYPFLKDIGITLEQYGVAHNTYGVIASILGGLVGGAAISKWGLRRCIWPFVLALNGLNILYMLMAWKYGYILLDPSAGKASFALVALLLSAESFGSGLGTAIFMVFIMRTTRPEFKASHMAIATGLMNIAGTLAGVVSGYLAARLGFMLFFGLTFVATIPSMLLIPFLPYLDEGRKLRPN